MGIAAAVPFMDDPPAGIAGSIATLVIAAEIAAAIALVVIGRELYTKLWARLQALREELSEPPKKGEDHD